MIKAGGIYENNGKMWESHVVVDGRIITGQNPQSSKATADALIMAINEKKN